MAWRVESVMDQRLCFIAACLRADEPMSRLCLRFEISRKTGYKWLSRYRDFGAVGLVELSSARHTPAPAMDPAITDAVAALRKQRPTWGPRKLLARLSLDRPEIVWPASSTIGDFLHREGLSKPRSRRARDPSRKQPEIEPSAANESWSADFKGWFRTGDGVRCDPLTVTDNYSRYLLACTAVPQITTAHVQPILTGLFRRHGLPRALRTDNGSPFANRTGLGGLVQLSVWLLKLDIWPDRIAPGRPDQNGRHERMHRTLGEDVARQTEAQASWLARDIRMLTQWLSHDVLAPAGPALATRQMLFDFIVEELARREPEDARRVRPMRVALQNQRDTLLAFAGVLDDKLADIAQAHAIAEPLVREACVLHRLPSTSPAY